MKRAAIYMRVSTPNQEQEGTSLESQEIACRKYAEEHGYQLDDDYVISEVYTGLSIDRPGLNRIRRLVTSKAVEGLVIYSSDRFSREPMDLLTLIKECECNEIELLCVSEDLYAGEVGQLLNFVQGWASGLEARKIKERTMRGKETHAMAGDIPTGFGPYSGYMGLRYDPVKKKLKHTDKIEIARRILKDYISGKSSRKIHRELQDEGVCGMGEDLISLSTVNSVLKNAKAYAGVYTYNKYTDHPIEIHGKIEPIITMQEAELIAERKLRNKEQSYGYGKRTWLTGRVFCEICQCRYTITTDRSCYCNGSDRQHKTKCPAPKVGIKKLSKLVYKKLIYALSEPEAIMEQVQKNHDKWEAESAHIQELNQKKADRERRLKEKMGLLKDMYLDGDYTKEEYTKKRDEIKRKGERELGNIPELPPEPPTPEEIERTYDILKYYKPLRLHFDEVLRNPRDEDAARLAEMAGLKVIIGPPLPEYGGTKFTARINVNLPLPKKKEELREELWICADCNYTYSTLASDPDDSCPNCGADKLVSQWGNNKPEPFPNEWNPIAMVFSSS